MCPLISSASNVTLPPARSGDTCDSGQPEHGKVIDDSRYVHAHVNMHVYIHSHHKMNAMSNRQRIFPCWQPCCLVATSEFGNHQWVEIRMSQHHVQTLNSKLTLKQLFTKIHITNNLLEVTVDH